MATTIRPTLKQAASAAAAATRLAKKRAFALQRAKVKSELSIKRAQERLLQMDHADALWAMMLTIRSIELDTPTISPAHQFFPADNNLKAAHAAMLAAEMKCLEAWRELKISRAGLRPQQ